MFWCLLYIIYSFLLRIKEDRQGCDWLLFCYLQTSRQQKINCIYFTFVNNMIIICTWYDFFIGLGCLSQVLSSSQLFSTSLTHLDLSGNPGSLVTEEATVLCCVCACVCVRKRGFHDKKGILHTHTVFALSEIEKSQWVSTGPFIG